MKKIILYFVFLCFSLNLHAVMLVSDPESLVRMIMSYAQDAEHLEQTYRQVKEAYRLAETVYKQVENGDRILDIITDNLGSAGDLIVNISGDEFKNTYSKINNMNKDILQLTKQVASSKIDLKNDSFLLYLPAKSDFSNLVSDFKKIQAANKERLEKRRELFEQSKNTRNENLKEYIKNNRGTDSQAKNAAIDLAMALAARQNAEQELELKRKEEEESQEIENENIKFVKAYGESAMTLDIIEKAKENAAELERNKKAADELQKSLKELRGDI